MIWAWLGAAAVGLSLGLLGSGGAILTTPILVYLVGHDEKGAIAESLAIVAAIAVFGVARAAPQGRVDFRSAMLLAVPGILGTSIGAQVAAFLTGTVQLSLLAALMLTAAALMFRGGRVNGSAAVDGIGAGGDACVTTARSVPAGGSSLWVVGMQGVGLGLATGLVGVGGGFLIVPVLVLLRKLPMPTAVGTSLAIIAGTDEECSPGFPGRITTSCAGHVPTGGRIACHAHEQPDPDVRRRAADGGSLV